MSPAMHICLANCGDCAKNACPVYVSYAEANLIDVKRAAHR
jgi:hypothetical protein